MLVYFGRRLVVTLSDGTTVEGRLAWSWAWGFWRLKDPVDISGAEERPIQGELLVPRRSVVIAQVV